MKYKDKIFTIPNILSFFRLGLIPIIIWLYNYKGDYFSTFIVLLISGATDIVDGYIARRFDMVSDFGKAFDPIADKLTQIAMLFCLISRFPYMLSVLVLLVLKEVITAITAVVSIKCTGIVNGALWHGKLTTVVIYSMIVLHLVWYKITSEISLILVGVSIGIMLMSFIMYAAQNMKSIEEAKSQKE